MISSGPSATDAVSNVMFQKPLCMSPACMLAGIQAVPFLTATLLTPEVSSPAEMLILIVPVTLSPSLRVTNCADALVLSMVIGTKTVLLTL